MSNMPARMLPWFTAGHFCNDFAPCAIWIIAPAVALSMDMSPAELGFLFTIHSVGAALAYFPAGVISDTISDRGRLLLLTFVWVAVGYFMASYATSYWTLAILLAVAGIGDAIWHPVATGVVVEQFPGSRAKVLGIHAMGGTIADVAGPLAAGFLLSHLDWTTTLQVCVIPSAIMAVLFIPIARHIPRRDKTVLSRADFVELWQSWMTRDGLGVVMLICFYNMALMALLSMVPLYLQRVHALDTSMTGILFSIMLLAGALLQPIVGALSDRIGRRPVSIYGNVLAALAAGSMFVVPNLLGIVILQVVAIGVLVSIRSALLATAVEHSGNKESTTLGIAFSLMDGVGALGALIAGIVGTWDLAYPFLLATAFSAIATGFAMGMTRAPRPGASPS